VADLVLRGREIWMLEEDGREYVLARIPDHLTPEEWGWLYSDGPLEPEERVSCGVCGVWVAPDAVELHMAWHDRG
jgi:putative hemolysin